MPPLYGARELPLTWLANGTRIGSMNIAEQILQDVQKACDSRNDEVVMRVIKRVFAETKKDCCLSCWFKQFYVAAKIQAHRLKRLSEWHWGQPPRDAPKGMGIGGTGGSTTTA